MDPLRRLAWIFKLACVMAVVALIYPMQEALHRADLADRTQTCSHATALGEHQKVTLPDGSTVDLNTNTQIRCAFSHKSRNVEVSGEALFAVNSADPRPFQVLGGQLIVRDLSTSFDVLRRQDSTLVTVTAGRVKVAAPIGSEMRAQFREGAAADIPWKIVPEFRRLQQVEFYESGGTLHQHPDLDEEQLSDLLAWTRGWVDLRGWSLSETLIAYSRYQPSSRFIVKDGDLLGLKLGGRMTFTTLNDFLAGLHGELGLDYQIYNGSDGVTVVTLSRAKQTVVAR